MPWAITFTNPLAASNVGTPLGIPLHPTQLYDAGAELLILIVLLLTERRGKGFEGRTFWLYMLLYGISRFVVEFYRGRRPWHGDGRLHLAVRVAPRGAAGAPDAGAPARPRQAVSDSSHEEHLVADAEEAGLRIDVFLARRLPALSRSQIQRLIKTGHVTASDRPVKTSASVTAGLAVSVVVPAPEPADPIAESLPIDILHDDADLVVINKPAGMVVHPAPGHARGTVVNALLHHVGGLSGVGGKQRPGIVHRLDRGTSGVMVIAKHDRAHRELSRQFHDRTVVKEYVALVWGACRGRPHHGPPDRPRSTRPAEDVEPGAAQP